MLFLGLKVHRSSWADETAHVRYDEESEKIRYETAEPRKDQRDSMNYYPTMADQVGRDWEIFGR